MSQSVSGIDEKINCQWERDRFIDDLIRTICILTILSVPFLSIGLPFCPIPFVRIGLPFCPYQFVLYHFVLEPTYSIDPVYAVLLQKSKTLTAHHSERSYTLTSF